MAVFVSKMRNEPILVATFQGPVTDKDVMEFVACSAELSMHSDGSLYRVLDLTQAEAGYASVVSALYELNRSVFGAAVMPEMLYTFVGQPSMQAFFADQGLPFFFSTDEAVMFIQSQVSEPVAF